MHQVGHGLPLLVVSTSVFVLHVGPVNRRTLWNTFYMQMLTCGGVGTPCVVGRHGGLRLIYRFLTVIVEQLCHGRSYASCYGTPIVEILRTRQVVWIPLTPFALYKWFYAWVRGNAGSSA